VSALAAVDGIVATRPVRSVLFPLLGAGQGSGSPEATATAIVDAVVDHWYRFAESAIAVVYLLAYRDVDLAACVAGCRLPALEMVEREQAGRLLAEWVQTAVVEPAKLTEERRPKTLQLGFSFDVVGFGARSAPERDGIQDRLVDLLGLILTDTGTDPELVVHEWSGDGASAYLPGDRDPSSFVADLLKETARHLADDNRRHRDRIRLRMAVAVGLIGETPTGFSGPLAVELARMLDAPVLRRAVADNPACDFVVVFSDHVHAQVIHPGYPGLPTSCQRVEMAVKEFAAIGWLWLPTSF